VVGGFSLLIFLAVIFMITGFLQPDDGKEILKTLASIYSGFVGIIVGYYYAKSEKE